ncbi:uncharacterized protein LOC124837624 [Vigna umbellata]|uniref:uncharacterized protein LOC124837624 n=1 Tax=Vigna umbellata TaxID=87088 RepID=UPI001F5EC395|nr:uncharacterized protein LOC124837624 [Vigna umbellata]
MGNCGSNPKTNEGPSDIPEPVTEEVEVEHKESEANIETKTEETLTDAENKSLRNLLDEKVEEALKTEEVKAEAKAEEAQSGVVKVEEEKPKAEEVTKTEA